MLFRRRQVWLPTLWGWLVLLAVAAAAAIGLAYGVNGFLAPNAPARGTAGIGARTLVVEGWLEGPDLAQALAAYRRGHYERVLTTGGPIEPSLDVGGWHTFAERAAVYLRRRGPADLHVSAVPAPAAKRDRTYRSAVAVREWAQRSGVRLDAIDLFTAGVHARRSRLLYRMALGDDVEVGVIASVPEDFDSQRWWTTSNGAKLTVGEVLSLIWTECCFWPGSADAQVPAQSAGASR